MKDSEHYKQRPLTQGEDFYVENGLYVFTRAYLLKRGYCCESGCRHCPYGFKKENKETGKPRPKSN